MSNNQEKLKTLLFKCQTDTKKALRMGGANLMGMFPSWVGLAEFCMNNNQFSDADKKLIADELKDPIKKIKQSGVNTELLWGTWLFRCESKVVNGLVANFDNLKWFANETVGKEVFVNWLLPIKKGESHTIWWKDLATPINSKFTHGTLDKAEVLKNILNILSDRKEKMFEFVWPELSWFMNHNHRAKNIKYEQKIKEIKSDILEWAIQRWESGVEEKSIDVLFCDQSLDFWKYVFKELEIKADKQSNCLISKKVDFRLIEGFENNNASLIERIEKIDWLIRNPVWAEAILCNTKIKERIDRNWDFLWEDKDFFMSTLEKGALRSMQSDLSKKKSVSL